MEMREEDHGGVEDLAMVVGVVDKLGEEVVGERDLGRPGVTLRALDGVQGVVAAIHGADQGSKTDL